MPSYGICSDCGRAAWLPHRCKIWEWRTLEEDAAGSCYWSEVRANSVEDAAEIAAEHWDQDGGYYLLRNAGENSTILVREPETLTITYWKVRAEAVPTYYAKQITAD